MLISILAPLLLIAGRNDRKRTARNMSKPYAPVKEITVYYNPVDPKESRLKISLPWQAYMTLYLGTFLFLIGSLVDMLWLLAASN